MVQMFQGLGSSDAGIVRHVRLYAGEGLAAQVAGGPRIGDDRYDWSLNDLARPS